MTLEQAKTYLDKIEAAMLVGAESVEIAGRRVQYQSLDEMRTLANQLRRDIQRREGKSSALTAVWTGAK